MTKPKIILKQLTKRFSDENHRLSREMPALENINLEIMPGEFFVFLGPSGCGKSTLLRIMSKLEKKYEGSIEFDSEEFLSRIGFVFQQFALFPWLSVFQNVELALIARSVPDHLRKEKINTELKLLGLEKSAHLYPHELSGGMKQRVGIARALVTDPDVIFMDEPFSELDSFTASQLRKEILSIWRARQKTIILVTHIIKEAIELADRIAVLTPSPGKLEKIFVNHLPRPRHERSDEFYKLEDQLIEKLKP
ncbi:ABC transporter ATP-binding protein [Candidatus Azambacteria bacterium]|nr:ABC transporter ATP-binding protein [Candidatus Azambacteria bacterium]